MSQAEQAAILIVDSRQSRRRQWLDALNRESKIAEGYPSLGELKDSQLQPSHLWLVHAPNVLELEASRFAVGPTMSAPVIWFSGDGLACDHNGIWSRPTDYERAQTWKSQVGWHFVTRPLNESDDALVARACRHYLAAKDLTAFKIALLKGTWTDPLLALYLLSTALLNLEKSGGHDQQKRLLQSLQRSTLLERAAADARHLGFTLPSSASISTGNPKAIETARSVRESLRRHFS